MCICAHRDTLNGTHKQVNRVTESERETNMGTESTVRIRRNTGNITVSHYNAHRQEGTGLSLRPSSQALRWTVWDQAPQAAARSFQHSVPCQASTKTHKLSVPRSSQSHHLSRLSKCTLGPHSSLPLPWILCSNHKCSFSNGGSRRMYFPSHSWPSGRFCHPREKYFGKMTLSTGTFWRHSLQDPTNLKGWGWQCRPMTDTTGFGAMHTSCSWIPLLYRSGDLSAHFSPE